MPEQEGPQGQAPEPEFDELIAGITSGRAQLAHLQVKRESQDRSLIALIIVGAFVLLLVLMFGTVLFAMPVCQGEGCVDGVPAPISFLGDLLSSVLLPVVTLVLGYYFGTRNADI